MNCITSESADQPAEADSLQAAVLPLVLHLDAEEYFDGEPPEPFQVAN